MNYSRLIRHVLVCFVLHSGIAFWFGIPAFKLTNSVSSRPCHGWWHQKNLRDLIEMQCGDATYDCSMVASCWISYSKIESQRSLELVERNQPEETAPSITKRPRFGCKTLRKSGGSLAHSALNENMFFSRLWLAIIPPKVESLQHL